MNKKEDIVYCIKCNTPMEIVNNPYTGPFEILASGTGSTNISITRDPSNDYPITEEEIKIIFYRCPKCGFEDQAL
jgi:hypothetical protein